MFKSVSSTWLVTLVTIVSAFVLTPFTLHRLGDGGYGTSAYSDPKNDLVRILLTQRLVDWLEGPAVYGEFWAGAYGGIEG